MYRLNLTVANCVYLLEPQWNPMIENQAIARVLRLGQTRDVRVVRYIMKGTVEEVGYPLARLRRYKLTMVVGDANSAVTKARVRQSGVER